MNKISANLELRAHIESHTDVLSDLCEFLESVAAEAEREGRTRARAFAIAGVLQSYYTCAETVLFTILEAFAEEVDPARRHAHLLEQLSTTVDTIRPRVLSDGTFRALDELRDFRRSCWYYCRLDYDWEQLELLIKSVRRLHPALSTDFEQFARFLDRLG